MNQEVVKQETGKAVQVVTPQTHSEDILASDVKIPKLLLMQSLSEFVTDEKAKVGEFIKSTTEEKVGDKNSPVTIIPLTFKNTWVEMELVGGKPEFRGISDRNSMNENLPWEFDHNGAKWKRMKSIELFALLPQDIAKQNLAIKAMQETGEMPDLNTTLLPVVISFRSTSYNAGKDIATHFAKAKSLSKTMGVEIHPYAYLMELSSIKEENDKGTYYVMKAKTLGKASKEEIAQAQTWYNTLKNSSNIKVDEEKVEGTSSDEAPF